MTLPNTWLVSIWQRLNLFPEVVQQVGFFTLSLRKSPVFSTTENSPAERKLSDRRLIITVSRPSGVDRTILCW